MVSAMIAQRHTDRAKASPRPGRPLSFAGKSLWSDRTLKALLILCLILGQGMAGARIARSEMIEGIVAVVDDSLILMSDLMDRMQELGQDPYSELAQRQVLNLMIEDRIVERSYLSLGYPAVNPEQAQGVATRTGMPLDDARILIMKRTLMDMMVQSRVVITEGMVQQYYESTPEYAGHEAVHLKQLILNDDPRRVARALAELERGQPFDEVARTCADLRAAESPDIGWVGLSELNFEAKNALEDSRAGQIVGPVHARGYVFIFQVLDRGIVGGRELDEVRDEITRILEEKYRREAFDHWLKMIMSQHYVGIFL